MQEVRVERLNQTHPEYDGDELEEAEALYEGGKRWHRRLDKLLPKHPQEEPSLWEARKALATYENRVSGPLDVIAGMLVSEPPTLDEKTAQRPWASKFVDSVDNANTPLTTFFAERLIDALKAGRTFVWVNMPRPVAAGNRLEQERKGGTDAFLVGIDAAQVIDWENDELGNLSWVMLRDQYTRRESFEEIRVPVWRWTFIDGEQIYRWEWTPPRPTSPDAKVKHTPDENDVAKLLPGFPMAHKFRRVPVLRLQLPASLHAMGKLRDPAVNLTRTENQLDYALDRANHPILTKKGFGVGKVPSLGEGAYYFLRMDEKGVSEELAYVEPSGNSFATTTERIRELRGGIAALTHQMAQQLDPSKMRQAESGAAKAIEWRSLEIVLVKLADKVRPFIADCVHLVASKRDTSPERPTIGGLASWKSQTFDEFLALLAGAAPLVMSSPTAARLVNEKMADLLFPQIKPEDRDAIFDELQSAPPPVGTAPPGFPPSSDPDQE